MITAEKIVDNQANSKLSFHIKEPNRKLKVSYFKICIRQPKLRFPQMGACFLYSWISIRYKSHFD